MNTELAVVPVATQAMTVSGWAPSPLAEMPAELFAERLAMMQLEQKRIRQVQAAVMTVDVDYGKIPGTDKNALLKPGAELYNKLAGIVATFRETSTRGDGVSAPAIHYVVKCQLRRGEDGPLVSEGMGSANCWEKKYRYRKAERECPACKQPTVFKSKQDEGGWYCWAKKGGCGAKFRDGDRSIEEQQAGMIENPDVWDIDNTLLKMAEKRAFVDATLRGHALSGIMTQDIEDDGQDEPSPPPRKQTKAPPRARAASVRHDRDGVVEERISDNDFRAVERVIEPELGRLEREVTGEEPEPEWMGEDQPFNARDLAPGRDITNDMKATAEAAEKLRSVDRAKRETSAAAMFEMKLKQCMSKGAVGKVWDDIRQAGLPKAIWEPLKRMRDERAAEILATQPLGKPAGAGDAWEGP